MCGIAGIVRFDGQSIEQDMLDRFTDRLSRRGPDARGTYLRENVGLGHRRLSVLDLTDAAAQPMVDVDGQFVLVFNGEIYNFQEERCSLEAKGYRFRSKSDTEVLLNLYREYGEDCLRHLRGMFAFAILDRTNNKLFLARDRVGKKPLKYFVTPQMFAFASELKALRELPECPREVDLESIHHYLTLMYLPSPLTGFRGLLKLPAAHAMTVDLASGAMRMWRYWNLSYVEDEKPTLQEWQERIREVLTDSVQKRMIADVPLGAFLSGGVDSAAIVALMSSNSVLPIKTFSIGSHHSKFNELPHAQKIADQYGTDHHPILVEPNIVRLLPDLVRAYEEPYADTSSIPTFLIAQEARREVTVALNGDGGDENFAGYVRYPILQFSELWRRLPSPLHTLVSHGTNVFHSVARSTLSYRMKRFQHSISLPFERRYLQYLSYFTEEEKESLYREGVAFPSTDVWYAKHTSLARSRARHVVSQAMSMDVDTYLADDLLPKVDMGSMAHGLEARSPFLDHHLLELSAQIPLRWKLHGWTGKWILKDLLRGMVPNETLWKKKSGFRLPLDAWFRNELRSYVRERLLTPGPLLREIIDCDKLEKFLQQYFNSSVDYSDHIWSLLWLTEWMEQYT